MLLSWPRVQNTTGEGDTTVPGIRKWRHSLTAVVLHLDPTNKLDHPKPRQVANTSVNPVLSHDNVVFRSDLHGEAVGPDIASVTPDKVYAGPENTMRSRAQRIDWS
ncbi:hypothetical protein CCR75_004370 [Bremia lactucae]|uniref:Uncharacterized protein n=1 Tax=Bremia lactucae TaxID=4779 RepID=A0A976ID78_BRELC|nr:hypothetical protein CCR75_004370 [Bremia lactucae]